MLWHRLGAGAGRHQAGHPPSPQVPAGVWQGRRGGGAHGGGGLASYGLLSGHFGNTLSVAGAILVGCVVYVILVVVLRVVSKDDLSLMPKGEKIAKLLRIR